MSRRSRRQNRQKTFGWAAAWASPTEHNARVQERKGYLRLGRAARLAAGGLRRLARALDSFRIAP